MFSAEDVIAMAVQIEKNAEEVFRRAAKETSNSSLSQFLEWLADEEAKHATKFTELKPGAKATADDREMEALGRQLLKGILGDQTFSLKDVDFSRMDEVQVLLEAAIDFENDTVLFYEMLRSFVQEKEDLEHLDRIILEENNHVRLLQDFLESGTDPSDQGAPDPS